MKFMEQLEGRQLLSAATGAAKPQPGSYGPLEVTQTSDGGLIVDNAHSVQIGNVLDANDQPVNGWVSVDDLTDTAGAATYQDVKYVVVNGTKGDDFISAYVEGTVDATFNGGMGADRIIVSNNGSGTVKIYGGGGNDQIAANNNSTGTVTIYRGNGPDATRSPTLAAELIP